MSGIDPIEYLAALDDVRAEREALYPRPAEPTSSPTADERGDGADDRRRLPPATCELGLRKAREIRAALDARRADRSGRRW